MNTAELLIDCLIAEGIDVIFGVPGEENDDIIMAIAKKKLSFIVCRHEQTASFMAAMHGRLTGKPGVCLSTLGPGVTNLLTGVAQATLDGNPLIALIGQCSTKRLHKLSHQNINAIDLTKPVSKWSISIIAPEAVPEIVAKACREASNGYPGAVVIELPEDIAELNITIPSKPLKLPAVQHEEPTAVSVINLLKLLKSAKKPLLLLGEGAVRTEADQEIGEFLQKTGLYCAYTFMGKGCIPFTHPRSLHCVGLGMRDIVIDAFIKADLVICIGYQQIEWPASAWNMGKSKQIIQIHTNPCEIDEAFIPKIEIIGWIPSIMNAINRALDSSINWHEKYFDSIKNKIETDLRKDRDAADCPMTPKAILQIMRHELNEDSILISDVGAHKMWIARQYGAYHSKTCLISNGFCAMGGSIPGALAAKRLYPNKQVVAVCGDGGLVMSIQALFTGVMYKIPCVVVVWQDNEYGLIRWKQEIHYHQHHHTGFSNPDLCALTQHIGCHARTINHNQELSTTLQWALSHQDVPTVIIVPVDYRENMRLFHELTDLSKLLSGEKNNV